MNEILSRAAEGLASRHSAHYCFHFREGSAAHRDIGDIIRTQEECFERITSRLQVMPGFTLHDILLDTDAEVGALYEASCGVAIGPINGFAAAPDTVVAVYSDDVQCIGMHEGTHLIADLVKVQWQSFIMEGLAMYMDETWWGEPNEQWVSRFLADGRYVPLASLMPEERFHETPCEVSYPIAGAFTGFLIERLGMQDYLQRVYASDEDAASMLPALLGAPLPVIEEAFIQWIHARSLSDKG